MIVRKQWYKDDSFSVPFTITCNQTHDILDMLTIPTSWTDVWQHQVFIYLVKANDN